MLRAAILAIALISAVAPASPSAKEPVLIELHRDPGGLTVMGRFHGPEIKRDFAELLGDRLPLLEIRDLSGDTASDPGPGWGPEMEIAALAAAALENALVRIGPGRVRVEGTAADEIARLTLTDALRVAAGQSVELDLAIRVPPRAITPFEFTVVKTLDGLRVESCAVRNANELERIREILIDQGAPDGADVCREGLGGPPEGWATAAVAGLEALELLPAGRLRLWYLQLRLEATGPSRAEDMAAALDHLEDELPEEFQVRSLFSGDGDALAVPRDGYWMEIEAAPERLHLRGRLPGEVERDAFALFARALFPLAPLENGLTIGDRAPPRDWFLTLQIAAGALSELEEGSVRVSDGQLDLRGVAPRLEMAGTLLRDLRAALPLYRVNTSITVDLPALVAAIPVSEGACLAAMNRLILRRPIAFEQGEVRIDEASRPVLDELVALYRRCEPTRFQVIGFTDSQGREEINLRLSLSRAEAVKDALVVRGIPHMNVDAIGMGEASPVADNDTPEGRRLNRRVEFHPAEE